MNDFSSSYSLRVMSRYFLNGLQILSNPHFLLILHLVINSKQIEPEVNQDSKALGSKIRIFIVATLSQAHENIGFLRMTKSDYT